VAENSLALLLAGATDVAQSLNDITIFGGALHAMRVPRVCTHRNAEPSNIRAVASQAYDGVRAPASARRSFPTSSVACSESDLRRRELRSARRILTSSTPSHVAGLSTDHAAHSDAARLRNEIVAGERNHCRGDQHEERRLLTFTIQLTRNPREGSVRT